MVVVEPYASSRGHDARSLTDAAEALELVVDRVVAVGDRSPLVSDRSRNLTRSAAVYVMRAFGALRAGIALVGRSGAADRPLVAWCGDRREMVRSLGYELPVLWAARGVGRRLRREGYEPRGLVTSSFVRPLWLKPALMGFPTVEQVFEPCRRPERVAPRRRWRPRVGATSAAVADSVEATVAGARVRRLAHFPLWGSVAPGGEESIGDDLLTALAPWRSGGRPWALVFGTGHVKKDLAVVLEAVDHLDDTVGLALVGRLGAKVEPEDRRWLTASGRCVVVDRYVTEAERRWLFDQAGAVVLCDRAGTVSLSGSLLDAVAAGCPVVAPEETESGRLVRAVGLGRVYHPGAPAGLAAAVGRALSDPTARAVDHQLLRDEGLLPAPSWARAVRICSPCDRFGGLRRTAPPSRRERWARRACVGVPPWRPAQRDQAPSWMRAVQVVRSPWVLPV